jgi:hypothetical protein
MLRQERVYALFQHIGEDSLALFLAQVDVFLSLLAIGNQQSAGGRLRMDVKFIGYNTEYTRTNVTKSKEKIDV